MSNGVSMRVDRFLKLSRLVPRRSGAKELCDAGEVRLNGQVAKAGHEVRPGDRLRLQLPARELEVEVLAIPAGRSVARGEARLLFRLLAQRRFDPLGQQPLKKKGGLRGWERERIIGKYP